MYTKYNALILRIFFLRWDLGFCSNRLRALFGVQMGTEKSGAKPNLSRPKYQQ
ncbi:MAG: hypothetical protein QXV83_00315 [Candidatus Anstonellaceae archaeon]